MSDDDAFPTSHHFLGELKRFGARAYNKPVHDIEIAQDILEHYCVQNRCSKELGDHLSRRLRKLLEEREGM